MKERARSFRKNLTDAENRLWYFLRDRRLNGYKFVREHVIGSYIVDFVCRQKKLIIELDGGQHADTFEYDEKRTTILKEKGYHVLRIWNDHVFTEIEVILEAILNLLETSQTSQQVHKKTGFSLFEILIALSIISILTTLSFPLYNHYLIHANRLEAKMALVKLAGTLEQYYTVQNTYKNTTLQDLEFPEFTSKNNYQLAIVSATDINFVIQAKPIGNQELKDLSCGILRLDARGEKSITGTETITACW